MMKTGVPRGWADPRKLPKSGTFRVDYVCSPEERNLKVRLQLLAKYAYWNVTVEEDQVEWWAGLAQAPEDVLLFMEFIASNTKWNDVYEPFVEMAGEDESINLQEFQDGFKKLECKKFKGRSKHARMGTLINNMFPAGQMPEAKRIEAVFRYLDPSGEGTISRTEWAVLEYLYKEVQQSIQEFVHFLRRTYGGPSGSSRSNTKRSDLSKTNSKHSSLSLSLVDESIDSIESRAESEHFLDVAWRKINGDSDAADDVITEEEWDEKIINELRYFGPSKIIFRYLDKDDEGSLSIDEFQLLRKFDV